MQFAIFKWRTYEPYVDNHATDFIARHEDGRFLTVQVKTVRKRNYAFIRKRDVKDSRNTCMALVLLDEGEPPRLFVIPLLEWVSPNRLLVDRDYVDGKSDPEYGVQASPVNQALLEKYAAPPRLR